MSIHSRKNLNEFNSLYGNIQHESDEEEVEEKPLIDQDKKKIRPTKYDHVDRRKFLICFDFKCEIYFHFAVLTTWLIVDYGLQLYCTSENTYYDDYYSVLLGLLLIPFGLGVIAFILYAAFPDSP